MNVNKDIAKRCDYGGRFHFTDV